MSSMRLASVTEVRRRLGLIFPETAPDRAHLIRELAARTVVTFLFVGAVGDPDLRERRLLRPSMVAWLDDESLSRSDDHEFVVGWHCAAARGQAHLVAYRRANGVDADRWYADNSRESIRDEVIRPLNERYGAVLRRSGVATTGATPALALAQDFADLFDPDIAGSALSAAIVRWQRSHLGPAAYARLEARRRLDRSSDAVVAQLPGRGQRQLPPGPSSVLSAAVIEDFSTSVLSEPYVLAICHSRDPIASEDELELSRVGLTLDREVALPDLLLLDASDATFWFVEVVVTDGPIHDRRRDELLAWATSRGVESERCRFVTAYRSRVDPVFRRTVAALAWDTYAWFADEPRGLVRLDRL